MSFSVGPIGTRPYDDLELVGNSLKPLWSVDFDNEEKILKWAKSAIDFCSTFYRPNFQVQLDNILVYKGIQWLNQDRYSNRFLDRQGAVNRRSPRVVFNYSYDSVEHWVSKLTRYRPAVGIYPANAEQQDIDDAKTSKDVLSYIWYRNKIDLSNSQMVRLAKVCGEAYRFIEWDPNLGDIHPDQAKINQTGERVPILDDQGNPVSGEDGDPLYIDKQIKIGEVRHSVWPGYHVFEEPVRNRDDITWCIRWSTAHVDNLKAKYPNAAHRLNPDKGFEAFTDFQVDVGKLRDEIVVYELFGKHTEFLSKGRYLKFTKDVVLENIDLPYSHGRLPYIILTDIDVPGQIRGMSFLQQMAPIQHQINACASLIYKSLVLFSHPKWVAPENSIDLAQLLAESTVAYYSGGVPPSLANYSSVSGELFSYLSKLETIFHKLSGQYEFSTGQAPSGVRAAKALRLIDEQEDKHAFYMATKFNDTCLVSDAQLVLPVAGDYYDDSDGRLARILGKNNEYKIKKFKSANLGKPYDVRIENTTAISQSRSGKIEDMIELAQTQITPDSVVTKEQFIKELDLSAAEEYKDITTRAVDCASAENEDLRSGMQVSPPTPEEDLITHWRIHLQLPQSREWKELVSEDRKVNFRQHVYTTEYLMFKKAFGLQTSMGQFLSMPNPVFAQKLAMECPNWPVFFEIPVPGLPPMGMPGSGMMPPPGLGDPLPPQQAPLDTGVPLEGGVDPSTPPIDPLPPL